MEEIGKMDADRDRKAQAETIVFLKREGDGQRRWSIDKGRRLGYFGNIDNFIPANRICTK
jgi:hypothetical protein